MSGARRPWNPFRSEAEAYRFLIATVVYFAAIVVASLLGGTWAGVAVFAVLTVAGMVWILRRGRVERPVPQVPRAPEGAEPARRILVIANETVAGQALREAIEQASRGVREQVLVVCPALNTPLRHWTSDEDAARDDARRRLDVSLRQLAGDGVEASGEVGDADPLQAIEDALRTFGGDEIVVSSSRGRNDVVERLRERFAVPVSRAG